MRVFLLKDVERVGIAGEIIKTTEGYARNFLIPKKLGIEVTEKNEAELSQRIKTVVARKEVIASKTSMLAERIKSLQLTVKKKVHDGGKLYGSIGSGEIVELLAGQGISVEKNQVEFDKSIKNKGLHTVKIKLSTKLQPSFTLKVVAEEASEGHAKKIV